MDILVQQREELCRSQKNVLAPDVTGSPYTLQARTVTWHLCELCEGNGLCLFCSLCYSQCLAHSRYPRSVC